MREEIAARAATVTRWVGLRRPLAALAVSWAPQCARVPAACCMPVYISLTGRSACSAGNRAQIVPGSQQTCMTKPSKTEARHSLESMPPCCGYRGNSALNLYTLLCCGCASLLPCPLQKGGVGAAITKKDLDDGKVKVGSTVTFSQDSVTKPTMCKGADGGLRACVPGDHGVITTDESTTGTVGVSWDGAGKGDGKAYTPGVDIFYPTVVGGGVGAAITKQDFDDGKVKVGSTVTFSKDSATKPDGKLPGDWGVVTTGLDISSGTVGVSWDGSSRGDGKQYTPDGDLFYPLVSAPGGGGGEQQILVLVSPMSLSRAHSAKDTRYATNTL